MNRAGRTKEIIYPPLFALLMAVCSWINIPSAVPFTMQTFAVAMTLFILGGKRGTISLAVYLFMGAIGLPVFHGFTAGPGVIMSSTGGYLLGFVLMGLVYWGVTYLGKDRLWSRISGMVFGMSVCYGMGTCWFMLWYTDGISAASFAAALGICVVPFIIPDIIKILLALWAASKIEGHTGKLYL